jgi:hypothetical protein
MNGKMMETMHRFHVLRDVQPTVRKVIQRFYHKYMTHEGIDGARFHHRIIGEEHTRENDLQRDLDPHMQNNSNQVFFFFSAKLFLSQLIVIVILITEYIVETQKQMS